MSDEILGLTLEIFLAYCNDGEIATSNFDIL